MGLHLAETRARIEDRGVLIAEQPARAAIALRGDVTDARFSRAVESVTDLKVPSEPNTSVFGLLASLLWLGPDEWLVTSETQRGDELVARLRQALHGVHAAVTEVGAGRSVFAVSGERARSVLAKGCAIDLHPRAFGSGRCAQTLLAKAAVLLHQRTPEPAFDVYVARSYADYLRGWLDEAAREYR